MGYFGHNPNNSKTYVHAHVPENIQLVFYVSQNIPKSPVETYVGFVLHFSSESYDTHKTELKNTFNFFGANISCLRSFNIYANQNSR